MTMMLAVLAMGCSPTEEEFTVTSPEGNVKVEVQATKRTALDPFMTEIKAEGYDMETAVQVEVYVKEMMLGKTVTFNWKNERECIITFHEQDGKKRNFSLVFSDGQVLFAEV